jgi:glycosyltransferase involved in cell wall biosynthesis
MCIVEAFACGVPVLCSRLGSLAEIVEDRRSGLHFHPGDSADLARQVQWAWHQPLELEHMGRTARAKYESDYTAEKNYSLLMKIYEQALTGPMDSPGRVVPRLAEKAGHASAIPEIQQAS